jgi:hypothetical protein
VALKVLSPASCPAAVSPFGVKPLAGGEKTTSGTISTSGRTTFTAGKSS